MDRTPTLLLFWQRLSAMSKLIFKTSNLEGIGEVTVSSEGENVIIYSEKGTWTSQRNTQIDFTNVQRWNLNLTDGVISLQHLRRGLSNPVALVDMVPVDSRSLSSVDCHVCGSDIYSARLYLVDPGLQLSWRVIGPRKDDEMEYCYS
ncbi:MAG: DUF6314 family protein [Chlamydiales bacterium]|nr:DUF6314 family protein [Chlamydiales bacterium]